MGKLVINAHLVTLEKAEALVQLCPFGAITYANGTLDSSSGCKMCKMCVRKGQGLVDFVEEVTEIDKSLWKGICVYADCTGSEHLSSRHGHDLRRSYLCRRRCHYYGCRL